VNCAAFAAVCGVKKLCHSRKPSGNDREVHRDQHAGADDEPAPLEAAALGRRRDEGRSFM
jgi:hypothetical protein